MTEVLVESDGDAASFHGRALPDDGRPHVWWFRPERSAVVLGSTQDDSVLDRDACERFDLDVVKRRSGGGVVLVGEQHTLWVDVLIPRDHAVWDDDVARATWWLGETWREVLEHEGIDGLDVHRGPMQTSDLARVVCFAGRGPGEVFAGSAKAVGISQRRTRDWARFQCALSVRWDAALLRAVLRSDVVTRSSLDGLGTDLHLDLSRVEDEMTRRLLDRLG